MIGEYLYLLIQTSSQTIRQSCHFCLLNNLKWILSNRCCNQYCLSCWILRMSDFQVTKEISLVIFLWCRPLKLWIVLYTTGNVFGWISRCIWLIIDLTSLHSQLIHKVQPKASFSKHEYEIQCCFCIMNNYSWKCLTRVIILFKGGKTWKSTWDSELYIQIKWRDTSNCTCNSFRCTDFTFYR